MISVQMIGVIGIIVLIVLMCLRVPVAYAMMIVGLAVMRGWEAGTQMIISMLYSTFTSYSYSCIPMFILMGFLAYYAGILEELLDVAKKWIGHIHGGLVIAGILGGGAFGAVCGVASVASATLARVVIPELDKAKTERSLMYGSVSAAAVLAPLIPPSVLAMLIAVVLQVSIGKVLMGG